MTPRLPPLQWLRSFEAAARCLSFTAAAEQLHLTQSAVSQQVKQLEGFLGQPLFLRGARSLQLTDAGRHYLPTVTAAFRVLAEGTEGFLTPWRETSLEIKSNTAFSVFWLMPRIGDFLAAHPAVRLHISTALWTSDFAGSSASVEIRYGPGEWAPEQGERLSDDTTFPVCAPALAARLRDPADLAGETLLHVTQITDHWESWAAGRGLNTPRGRDAHYFETFLLALDMARRGLGVALGHDTLCCDLIERGELVVPFDLPVPARDNYTVVVPDRGPTNAAAQAFRDWLVRAFRESREPQEGSA